MIYGHLAYYQAERQETDRLGKGGKIWRTGELRNSQAPLFGGPLHITLGRDHRQRQVAAQPIVFRLSLRETGKLVFTLIERRPAR
jgi:hypothetical protein